MKKQKISAIKTFWFDLGNVILFFDFMPAFRKLARYTHLDAQQIRAYFKAHPKLEAHLDEGRVNAPALFRRLRRDLKLKKIAYADFKKIWNEIFTENRPVIELLRNLKKNGYRLVLISNTNRLHIDYIVRRYSVLQMFDHVVLSYKVRARKPHRKIYKTALAVSRAEPHEIFYTDDREDLIAAASANHGVHAHPFRTAHGLKQALNRLKVDHRKKSAAR